MKFERLIARFNSVKVLLDILCLAIAVSLGLEKKDREVSGNRPVDSPGLCISPRSVPQNNYKGSELQLKVILDPELFQTTSAYILFHLCHSP